MNLWQVIFNENITKMFIPVCLDNFTSKQVSSLSIKEIPAIVMSGDNQVTSVYEGPQKCSQWLNNFMMNRRQTIVQQVEARRRLIQKTQATARKQEEGAFEYVDAEMDGVSDNYAYTQTDLCQPKSYVMIGDEEKYNIVTPRFTDEKLDFEAMKKQLLDLESRRGNDLQQYKTVMEQHQINAVINYNNNNNC